jgi:hypothetical protein
MEEVFPEPAVKERYVKNLDKGYFSEIFAKAGEVEKRKSTRKRKGTRKKQKKRGKTRKRKD